MYKYKSSLFYTRTISVVTDILWWFFNPIFLKHQIYSCIFKKMLPLATDQPPEIGQPSFFPAKLQVSLGGWVLQLSPGMSHYHHPQESTLSTAASDRSSLAMFNFLYQGQELPEKHGPSEGLGGPPTCLLLTLPRAQGTWLHLQALWLLSCTQKPTHLPQLLKTMPKSKEGRDGNDGTAHDSTGATGLQAGGHHARSPHRLPPLASGSWGSNQSRDFLRVRWTHQEL